MKLYHGQVVPTDTLKITMHLVNINYTEQQLTTYRPTTASVIKRKNTKYWIVQKDCQLNETGCCVFTFVN